MMQYRGILPLQRASRACLNLTLRSHASNGNCCDNAAPLEPLVPPAPGTVKEHFHHILLRLNEEKPGHTVWENKVER
jgi:hypothetical protein